MDGLICHMKGYIQPFERVLAMRELQALAQGPVIPLDGDDTTALRFQVDPSNDANALRSALAYWESVGRRTDLTEQVKREATVSSARRSKDIDQLSLETTQTPLPPKLPARRCLRYATHGLHEYRGKFFPQLVQALMNVAQLPGDGIVLDPMCGSGTTLVEARLSGRRCYGIDMNPLSVYVTAVKCEALGLRPAALRDAYDMLEELLVTSNVKAKHARYLNTLDPVDKAYLEGWFAKQTLQELDKIVRCIQQLPTSQIRRFYRVCLSNILRGVSLQKDDDLRVRRAETQLAVGETTGRFLKEALYSTKMVVAFLLRGDAVRLGRYSVLEGDARKTDPHLAPLMGRVDAVITSPPYATALPYLDTDRLSLSYLGLLPRAHHRRRDVLMIGNREVTTSARREQWKYYMEHKTLLSPNICTVIDRIDRLNSRGAVGFRRRNLAALLSKYFFDMREVMRQMFVLLRPGGVMFLVIGNNRTTAGTQPVEIHTIDYLTEIAETVGFRMTDDVPMDRLASRDIFRKNAVRSERIIRVEKDQ